MATERLSKLQDELSAVRTENTRLQEENGALRRQSALARFTRHLESTGAALQLRARTTQSKLLRRPRRLQRWPRPASSFSTTATAAQAWC